MEAIVRTTEEQKGLDRLENAYQRLAYATNAYQQAAGDDAKRRSYDALQQADAALTKVQEETGW